MAQSFLLSPEAVLQRFRGKVSNIISVKSVESRTFKRLFLSYPGKLRFSRLRTCGAGVGNLPCAMMGPPFRPENEKAIHNPKLSVRAVYGFLFLLFHRTALRRGQGIAVQGVVLLPVLQKE
ncbi:hypothetical protein [Solibaculum mannosilyticum]|uniref:hypothetical protein n=1 Tax=Solibaculum mannosilyticum TaxID=2780922 RepID=UPI0036F42B51